MFSRVWVCDGNFQCEIHGKNGVENGKFHANFTLLGRSAEKLIIAAGAYTTPIIEIPTPPLTETPPLWKPLSVSHRGLPKHIASQTFRRSRTTLNLKARR